MRMHRPWEWQCRLAARVKGAHLKADDVLPLGVRPRHLDGVVDGLGAAVGEEEPAQAGRHNLQQPVQQTHLHTIIALSLLWAQQV